MRQAHGLFRRGSKHRRHCSSKIYGVPASFDITLTLDFHQGGCGEPQDRPLRTAPLTCTLLPPIRTPRDRHPSLQQDTHKVSGGERAGISFSAVTW